MALDAPLVWQEQSVLPKLSEVKPLPAWLAVDLQLLQQQQFISMIESVTYQQRGSMTKVLLNNGWKVNSYCIDSVLTLLTIVLLQWMEAIKLEEEEMLV